MTLANPFIVEMERLPRARFEQSTDWSDLAVSRVVATPLFVEREGRTIAPGGACHIDRLSDVKWRVQLPAAKKDELTASEAFCWQIRAARKAGRISSVAASHVAMVRGVDSQYVEIETRFPFAHLERLLAHPGLTPYRSGARFEPMEQARALLLRSQTGSRSIRLVASGDDATDGSASLYGPMALDHSLPHQTTPEKCCRFDLDIYYALLCPEATPVEARRAIESGLDRAAIFERLGKTVLPCSSLLANWMSDHACEPAHRGDKNLDCPGGTLFFSRFPGNRAIAEGVCRVLQRQFGLDLHLRELAYDDLINSTTATPERFLGYRLVLIASPWPHPLSCLAPYVFSRETSIQFKDAYLSAAAAVALDDVVSLAAKAEAVLAKDGRTLIVLGRAIGMMWPLPEGSFCPPSGWLDLEAVANWVPD